jgi:hypothetical protein
MVKKKKEQKVSDDKTKKAEAPVVDNGTAEREKSAAIKNEKFKSTSSTKSKQLSDSKKVVRALSANSRPSAKRKQLQTMNSNGTISVKSPKIKLGPKGNGKTSGFGGLKDEIK